MDVLVHALFFALFILAILQFPDDAALPAAFKPVAIVAVALFSCLSLGLNAQRWRRAVPIFVLTAVASPATKASTAPSSVAKADLTERLMSYEDVSKAELYSGEGKASPLPHLCSTRV